MIEPVKITIHITSQDILMRDLDSEEEKKEFLNALMEYTKTHELGSRRELREYFFNKRWPIMEGHFVKDDD